MRALAFTTSRVSVGPLDSQHDVEAVRRLFAACEGDAVLREAGGADAAVQALFAASSPTATARSLALGITATQVEPPRLMGAIDVTLEYPAAGDAYIGLLIIARELRGGALGTEIVDGLLATCAASGIVRVRCSVLEADARALAFWRSRGFRPVERRAARIELERRLARPGPREQRPTRDGLQRFIDARGRLERWPVRHALQREAHAWLAATFTLDRDYSEREVNAHLNALHTFADPALLRRDLVDAKFLARTDDCGRYWRSPEADCDGV